jgi:thiosulfate/3-mercaptopyruvate sulfurtransferase
MQKSKLALISTQELAEILLKKSTPSLKVLDCSHTVDTKVGEARTNFHKSHIPTAQFLDLDTLHDQKSPYPMTMPQPDYFIRFMRRLNIKLSDEVVCYDTGNRNVFGHRVAWMFMCMGKNNVKVLDGGFAKWTAEGLPIETTPDVGEDTDYAYKWNENVYASFEQVNVDPLPYQLIDVRS